MTVNVPDRFKAANAFWMGLAKIGLTPAAVLSQARLPLTVYDGKKNFVTTAQFFALWRAVGELSADPSAGKRFAPESDFGPAPAPIGAKSSEVPVTMKTPGVANLHAIPFDNHR